MKLYPDHAIFLSVNSICPCLNQVNMNKKVIIIKHMQYISICILFPLLYSVIEMKRLVSMVHVYSRLKCSCLFWFCVSKYIGTIHIELNNVNM